MPRNYSCRGRRFGGRYGRNKEQIAGLLELDGLLVVLVGIISSVPLRQELGNRVVLRDGGEFELLHRIIVQFVYFDTYGVRFVRVGQLLRLAALVGRLEEHSALDSRSDIADQIATDESSGGDEVIEEVLIIGKACIKHGVGELEALDK